ncbi:hypothetical protein BTO15_00095 [Polaribacter sejongensis]|uniref:Uncharacterized protein n=1 Tax=Polaribacter sejongensis TaxID=985043 RepID=A0ABM6PV88_9FLAO|nr:hypothetical protein [Polaribacter sejongensis]AUC20609.1 hypothetical protein BTO15_00095 [Polaribacter sejongensis]
MKLKYVIIFLSIILFYNCSERNNEKVNPEILNGTPETLEQTESKISYSSISKRYGGNILEELYQEALEKSEKLEILNERIKEISSDSLQTKTNDFIKYRNVNNDYWNAAENYANNINDSIAKTSMIEIIEKLKKKYGKKVAQHETKMREIEVLKSKLNDQIILMKLFVTEPMISNYQINELPEKSKLESIIKDYTELIKQTEEYTRIEK